MFKISSMTEAHAQQEGVINNGSETVVKLVGGGDIRSGEDYVRVCDDDGRELMYWHRQEFEEDFNTAMGNFLQLAAACVEAGTRTVGVAKILGTSGDLEAGDFEDCDDTDALLDAAGRLDEKGCYNGTLTFEGEDGEVYVATREIVIAKATPEWAADFK